MPWLPSRLKKFSDDKAISCVDEIHREFSKERIDHHLPLAIAKGIFRESSAAEKDFRG